MRVKAQNAEGFGSRLARERERLGLSQSEMADKLGVALRTYTRSEHDERAMDAGELAKLATLGIGLNWLLTGLEASDKKQPTVSSDPLAAIISQDYAFVPRYNVRASAGSGALINSEQIVDYIAFRKQWIRDRLAVDPAHLILIEASGDSMAPTIQHGDLLLVYTLPQGLKDSAIYVVAVDGELMVKRVEKRLSGGVIIKSDNPRHDSESLTPEEADRLNVVGQVVWHGGFS